MKTSDYYSAKERMSRGYLGLDDRYDMPYNHNESLPVLQKSESEIDELKRKNNELEKENHVLMMTHCKLQNEVSTITRTLNREETIRKVTEKELEEAKKLIKQLQNFTRFEGMDLE